MDRDDVHVGVTPVLTDLLQLRVAFIDVSVQLQKQEAVKPLPDVFSVAEKVKSTSVVPVSVTMTIHPSSEWTPFLVRVTWVRCITMQVSGLHVLST